MNVEKDFPFLKKDIHYLDNAAMMQMPSIVSQKINEFVLNGRANVGRGFYKFAVNATQEYERARKVVADFINASPEEIIFTRGTTDSLNLVARGLAGELNGKNILLTEMEHHSNLVPWQELARREKAKLNFVSFGDNFEINLADVAQKIKDCRVFSFTHVSNVLGSIHDAAAFCKIARENEVICVVDAAQSVSSERIDVKEIDCDFLAFSSHKLGGPTGIGVLYCKRAWIDRLELRDFGGGMVDDVLLNFSTFVKNSTRFEAGTPNVEGAIGLAAAIEYLQKIGVEKISSWQRELAEYCILKLKEIGSVEIYTGIENKGIVSFNLKGIHPHDVASLLDERNVCVRAGHHCCAPLMKTLGLSATVRASFALYNTREDVDALIDGLKYVKEVFRK